MTPRLRKLAIAAEILYALAIAGFVLVCVALVATAGTMLADEVRDPTRLDPEAPSQVEPEPAEIVVDDALLSYVEAILNLAEGGLSLDQIPEGQVRDDVAELRGMSDLDRAALRMWVEEMRRQIQGFDPNQRGFQVDRSV